MYVFRLISVAKALRVHATSPVNDYAEKNIGYKKDMLPGQGSNQGPSGPKANVLDLSATNVTSIGRVRRWIALIYTDQMLGRHSNTYW